MKLTSHAAFAIAAAAALAPAALGSFTVIKNYGAWSAAAGPSTTLDFVFPNWQIMSDQYASLGVIFPEAEETAIPGDFPQDGWGCKGALANDDDIHLKLLQPQFSIGSWFPGDLTAKLYWQGQLIYSSPNLHTFGQTYQFGGIVSTQPFDEVVFIDPFGFVVVDDILFASNLPAPGALALIIAYVIGLRRRRDR